MEEDFWGAISECYEEPIVLQQDRWSIDVISAAK